MRAITEFANAVMCNGVLMSYIWGSVQYMIMEKNREE